MTRVSRGTVTRRRHKRILKQTKGYWGQRKNILQRARETLMRALAYAYRGRKMKKRDMRALFISRIKAASERNGLKYNKLIHGLKKTHVQLNRKMLSQIAIYDPAVFTRIVEMVR
jgi:large subunit ribosomal protein L20